NLQGAVKTLVSVVVVSRNTDVVCAEVQRQLLIVQQQHAVAKIGTPDGQIKKLLHWLHSTALDLRLGCVGAPVGIDDEVNDWILKPQIPKVHSRLQERNNVQAHVRAIGMHIRQLRRPFATVDGQIAGIKFQLAEVPVEGLQIDPAAGGIFERGDHLAPDEVPEVRAP